MKQHGLRSASRSARRVLERLVDGLDELGAHKKIDTARGTFMAVVVERIDETAQGSIFSIAHYFEQSGDLVPDPDVTFLRSNDGDFYPLSYQDARVFRRAVDFGADGSLRVDRRQQMDLAAFATMWMRNVSEQQRLVVVDRKKLEALVWRHTHRDFRGVGDDGARRVLYLNPTTGGTDSWPLSSFTVEQLIAKLPAEVHEGLTKVPSEDS